MTIGLEVAVGVCTFRRPKGLRQLLEAVAVQQLDRYPDISVTIVVVDNDDTATAQDLAKEFDGKPFPLTYSHQPERGLVHARNRLLEQVPDKCRWLAFVDDDEIPVTTWLQSLLETAQSYDVPIVAGLVEPIFRETPPDWIVDGEFFRRGPVADGSPTDWISTQNALIDMAVLRKEGWRFHMEFNRSGGEDEHFFQKAISDGYAAVVSNGAIVHDDIPPDRLKLQWMWRRNLRMGTTLAKIDLMKAQSWRVIPLRAGKSLVRMILGLARLAISPLRGRVAMARGCLDIARALGAMLGLLGIRLKLYG